MVKIVKENIPLNFKDLADQIELHKEFIEHKEIIELHSNLPEDLKKLTISYQGSANGYVLFSVGEVDLWLCYTPEKTWIQVYIAYDKKFEEEVLIEKYNHNKIFEAVIEDFQQKLAVYTKRLMS